MFAEGLAGSNPALGVYTFLSLILILLMKFLYTLALGCIIQLLSCQTEDEVIVLDPPKIEYGIKDLGEGRSYIGANPNDINTFQEALERVKDDKNSGSIFIGYSDEELSIAKDVIDRYNKINPKIIDTLEPITIKVNYYKPTPEEKERYEQLSKIMDEGELSFDELREFSRIERRLSPYLGMVVTNVEDLDKRLNNVNKHNVETIETTKITFDWSKFWLNKDVFYSWLDGEISINDLKKATNTDFPDNWDIIYWVGTSNKSKDPGYVLAHEFGHIVNFDYYFDLSNLVERFHEINSNKENYFTSYSNHSNTLASLLSVDEFEKWRSENMKDFFKKIKEGINEHKEDISKTKNDIKKARNLCKTPKQKEEIEKHVIPIYMKMIKKSNEYIGKYEKLQSDLNSIPENVLKKLSSISRHHNLNSLEVEDIAEAFAYVATEKKAPNKACEEKIKLIKDFLTDL